MAGLATSAHRCFAGTLVTRIDPDELAANGPCALDVTCDHGCHSNVGPELGELLTVRPGLLEPLEEDNLQVPVRSLQDLDLVGPAW